jgi:hypothetical protein
MDAAEHFDWAVGRAMEYVELNQAGNAMASLISDLGKHAGTAGILTQDLCGLFMGEVMLDGARGAQRFIEGIPRPVSKPDSAATPPAADS